MMDPTLRAENFDYLVDPGPPGEGFWIAPADAALPLYGPVGPPHRNFGRGGRAATWLIAQWNIPRDLPDRVTETGGSAGGWQVGNQYASVTVGSNPHGFG